MYEKRLELLEPIFKEINPKAYQAMWQKLLVTLAEIYNDMFEHKFTDFNNQKKPKPEKIDQMNKYGEESIRKFE